MLESSPLIQSIIVCELGAKPMLPIADSFIAGSTPVECSRSSTIFSWSEKLTYGTAASCMIVGLFLK